MQSLDQQESRKCRHDFYVIHNFLNKHSRMAQETVWDTTQTAIDTNMNMLSAKACYLSIVVGIIVGQINMPCQRGQFYFSWPEKVEMWTRPCAI